EFGKPLGHILFVDLVDENAPEGVVEIEPPVARVGIERRGFPTRRPAGPVFLKEIVEPRRGSYAFAIRGWISPHLRIGDDPARDHLRLMAREHRRRADSHGAQPAAHPGLHDVDVASAGIVADAEAVLDPKPGRRPRFAFRDKPEVYRRANLGQRL